MSTIPKHEATAPRKRAKKAQPQPAAPPAAPATHQHEVNYVAGLDGIEGSLDGLARAVSRLTSDEHAVSLCTPYGSDPLRITLAGNDYDDVLSDLVTAVQRIADSLAKIAGLNRPRLEHWYEESEYDARTRHDSNDTQAIIDREKKQ